LRWSCKGGGRENQRLKHNSAILPQRSRGERETLLMGCYADVAGELRGLFDVKGAGQKMVIWK
jgi:hypothetical protein